MVRDAFATWKAEIARADEWLDALAEGGLGREVPHGDGTVATRDVLVHVIEEYAPGPNSRISSRSALILTVGKSGS